MNSLFIEWCVDPLFLFLRDAPAELDLSADRCADLSNSKRGRLIACVFVCVSREYKRQYEAFHRYGGLVHVSVQVLTKKNVIGDGVIYLELTHVGSAPPKQQSPVLARDLWQLDFLTP